MILLVQGIPVGSDRGGTWNSEGDDVVYSSQHHHEELVLDCRFRIEIHLC